jgi:hypothetical protein
VFYFWLLVGMGNLGFFLAQMEASILLGWGSAQKILRTAGADWLMKTDGVAPKKKQHALGSCWW